MVNLTFTIGSIKITPLFWSLVIGFVAASFSLWRSLKREDIEDEEIYRITILLLLAAIAFSQFFLKFINLPIFGAFWGGVLILVWRMKTSQLNIWDGIEALTKPLFYLLIIGSIGSFLTFMNYFSLGFLLVGILGLIISLFLKKKYRSLSWYKSGKPGFVFWFGGAFFFIGYLAVDIWNKNGLYLTQLMLLISFFACVAVIYIRSERKIKEDINNLFKKK